MLYKHILRGPGIPEGIEFDSNRDVVKYLENKYKGHTIISVPTCAWNSIYHYYLDKFGENLIAEDVYDNEIDWMNTFNKKGERIK